MTADQRFTISIALLTLLFMVLTATLGLLIRAVVRWTKVEDRLADLTADQQEILNQMREDRKATNERLTYLERSVWPRSRTRGG